MSFTKNLQHRGTLLLDSQPALFLPKFEADLEKVPKSVSFSKTYSITFFRQNLKLILKKYPNLPVSQRHTVL